MYTGQYHFFIPIFSQGLSFADNFFYITGTHRPPSIWNNAVSTEVIAAILYLDIGADSALSMSDRKFFIFVFG